MPGNYKGIPASGRGNGNKSALNTLKNILSEQTNSNGSFLGGCYYEVWRISVSYSVALLTCLFFSPLRSYLFGFILKI